MYIYIIPFTIYYTYKFAMYKLIKAYSEFAVSAVFVPDPPVFPTEVLCLSRKDRPPICSILVGADKDDFSPS